MNDETVISWTVANWITVLLMVILGFAILGLFGKVVAKVGGKGGGNEAA